MHFCKLSIRFYCKRKAAGGGGVGCVWREQEGRSQVSEAGALEGVPESKAFALTHAQTHLAHLC